MLFAMTAAWYKNVVQTSGLLFHVDQWGLDSSVSVGEALIGAAPGDSAMLDLSVDNTSGGIISVSLGVSKDAMYNDLADMRKRLFFYIDDMVSREGEDTPRVYLNSVETYSYSVLPEQSLVLGTNGNAAPLMWEWVFDVLGYYFYGTVTPATTAVTEEYLRPVEYTLDRATFRNGVVETVDGTTTPAAFIEELTANDGYAGVVTTTVTAADGRVYYPVSVDDGGTGVWIYLCNVSEIEYETAADTQLGSADSDEQRQFEAYLHVTAEQKQLTVAQVNTVDQLVAALNDDAYNMVQLTDNVALSESLTVSGTNEKILDLDGHTLSTTAGQIVLVENGGSLTVLDGALQGSGKSSSYGVVVHGGDVAMSSVTITDTDQGVRITDDAGDGNDSRVVLTGCEIHSTTAGIQVRGNGPVTEADTCLLVEDCVIYSELYCLCGNGTVSAKGNYGTDVTVRNSQLYAERTSIYHPQRDSILRIENSTLESMTPLAVKGGTVKVTDSIITALVGPEDQIGEPQFVGSGFTNTNAAIYVETGYDYPTTVTVEGDCVVTSPQDESVMFYESTNTLYSILLMGGKYSNDVSAYLPAGYTCQEVDGYWVVSAE